MRMVLIGAALVSALAVVPAAAQSVGGNYKVSGTNFDGSAYSGTAQVTITSDTTCRIVWRTGGSTSSGICMRNTNAFSAGYVMGKKIGLVIYEIQTDGTLKGVWTIADQQGAGTEVLTPMP